MNGPPLDEPPREDPHAQLERAFVEEYLRSHGQSLSTLAALPNEEAHLLLRQASVYASARLSEVEARAHYVEDLHRAPQPRAGKLQGSTG